MVPLVAEVLFRLILLHGPEGQKIWVNPEAVTSVRVPQKDKDHLPPGTKCLINTGDGKFVAVVEDCDEVKNLGVKDDH